MICLLDLTADQSGKWDTKGCYQLQAFICEIQAGISPNLLVQNLNFRQSMTKPCVSELTQKFQASLARTVCYGFAED